MQLLACGHARATGWLPRHPSPMAKSFIHVNGSRKTMNPTSKTSAVDVPSITNVDVTLRPLNTPTKRTNQRKLRPARRQ
jgi:hypothetical protein